MGKRTSIIILLCVISYIIATGVSYALFTQIGQKKSEAPVAPPTKTETGEVGFDESLPKTEECPLNGAKYSKQQRAWWEKHRPLGVMIENHEDSRPQSGLSSADVMYEAVAEGGITRFLALFYCQDANPIGPVRSARTYFVDFLSEYGQYPLYAHVGGANTPGPANILSQLTDYEWTGYNDLNQFSIGFPAFWRDYDRLGHTTATEHTMYSTTTKLWDFAQKSRKLTNKDKEGEEWDKGFVKYSFKEDEKLDKRPESQSIHVEFWDAYEAYAIDWIYDKASNLYKRNNGSKPYIDNNTDKQLTAKNIVVLQMRESRANDGYEGNLHLLYKTKGTGKAFIFQDGKKITGTWKKDGRTSRTLLFDTSGESVAFNRGLIWFQILPNDGLVEDK